MKEGPELELRRIWSAHGVSEQEQDRMIAEIVRKASSRYWANEFKLGRTDVPPMPYCDYCGGYHHVTAECINPGTAR